jgi:hypothetical protein
METPGKPVFESPTNNAEMPARRQEVGVIADAQERGWTTETQSGRSGCRLPRRLRVSMVPRIYFFAIAVVRMAAVL